MTRPDESETLSESPTIPHTAWQTILSHSLLAGFCPLIPIPFLDDYIIRKIQGRMFQKLFEARDIELSSDGASILTDKPSTLLKDALFSAALYPFKKLFRKVFFVLAIKSCVDVASALFHEGWMIARLLELDVLDRNKLHEEDIFTLRHTRAAVLDSCTEIDTSPVRKIWLVSLQQSKSIFSQARSTFISFLAKKGDDDDLDAEDAVRQGGMGRVIDGLEEELRAQDSYFQNIENTLLEALRRHQRSAR